jgi:PD-(D/E)XK nuclease superfamily
MNKMKEEIEQIVEQLMDAMLKVHLAFGPGLLESTFQTCVAHELRRGAIEVGYEVALHVSNERVHPLSWRIRGEKGHEPPHARVRNGGSNGGGDLRGIGRASQTKSSVCKGVRNQRNRPLFLVDTRCNACLFALETMTDQKSTHHRSSEECPEQTKDLWKPRSSTMPYRPAVKIVATPGGEAPLDVREAWVGLTLPLTDPTPRMFEPEGVLTLSKQPSRVGYMVEGWKAVDMLAQKAPRAAEWWHEHAPHVLAPCYQLIFSADVCEIVQGH